MLDVKRWTIALSLILAISLLVPVFFVPECSTWYKTNWINIITLVVLSITAWGLIVYAADVRKQTQNLSRIVILPSISQEATVRPPRLSTNTLFAIANPQGVPLNVKVKIKMWVGNNRVPFSDDGLYDGRAPWVMTQGQFRGVINPGIELTQFIQKNIIGSLDISGFLSSDNMDLAEIYRNMPTAERVRLRLFVKYPEYTGEGSREIDGASLMYFLQPSEHDPLKMNAYIGFVWMPDPKKDRYPKDAISFDD